MHKKTKKVKVKPIGYVRVADEGKFEWLQRLKQFGAFKQPKMKIPKRRKK